MAKERRKVVRKDDRRDLNGGLNAWPFERICPVCGKVFSGTFLEEWVYIDRGELVCSWTCKRRREDERDEAAAARPTVDAREMQPALKDRLLRQLVCKGMSNREISEYTGLSIQLVNHYRRKFEEEARNVCDDGRERGQQGVSDVSAAKGGGSGRIQRRRGRPKGPRVR